MKQNIRAVLAVSHDDPPPPPNSCPLKNNECMMSLVPPLVCVCVFVYLFFGDTFVLRNELNLKFLWGHPVMSL